MPQYVCRITVPGDPFPEGTVVMGPREIVDEILYLMGDPLRCWKPKEGWTITILRQLFEGETECKPDRE